MTSPLRIDPAFAAPVAPTQASGPRPTFSVVIAAYNAAQVVGSAVESALAQTQPALEILVGDDGSTDDVHGALQRFGDAVTLRRLPHLGAAATRNALVREARADYVVVLDADDTWDPRRLERLGDLIEARPDLDVVTTDAWFVVDGRRRGRFYEANEFAAEEQEVEILRRTFLFSHMAVRREAWQRVGGMAADLLRGQDWDLQLRLILSGSAAGCVLEPLADYTVHATSLSASRHQSLMARVHLLDRAEKTHVLTSRQRRILREARRRYRVRGLEAHAEQLLIEAGPGRRRASLAIVIAVGAGLRQRVRAATAVIAPASVGNLLRRRASERGRAASDRAIA